jgi:hypothetical protein
LGINSNRELMQLESTLTEYKINYAVTWKSIKNGRTKQLDWTTSGKYARQPQYIQIIRYRKEY